MIRELATGQALVFAASQRLMPASELASTPLVVSVRARFTQDLGTPAVPEQPSIKLHDLLSTHPHCGLVATKREKSVLVSLA